MSEKEETALVRQRMSVAEIKDGVRIIQEVMKAVMTEGEHYGVIPGCQKPSLYKPGAEKLGLTFRLAPRFELKERDLPAGHREVIAITTLIHVPSGETWGQGVGSCSTLESKYRYREEKRKCPVCKAETIFKSKDDGSWFCWSKKGGCGRKYAADDGLITDQQTGRIDNEDIADQYNTVLKMAKKRSHVDAILTATAASDIFTQDMEETLPEAAHAKEPETKPKSKKAEPIPEQEKLTGAIVRTAALLAERFGLNTGDPPFRNWLTYTYQTSDIMTLDLVTLRKVYTDIKAAGEQFFDDYTPQLPPEHVVPTD